MADERNIPQHSEVQAAMWPMLWPSGSLDLYPRHVESGRLASSTGASDREAGIRAAIADEYPWVETLDDGWRAVTFFAEDGSGRPYLSTASLTGYPLATPRIGAFDRVDGTGLWSLTLRLAAHTRFEYRITRSATITPTTPLGRPGWLAFDEAGTPDPFNRRSVEGAFGEEYSLLELPGARPDLWPTTQPERRCGELRRYELPAVALGTPRTTWCYVPDEAPGARVVVLLDGEMWNERRNIAWLLDELIGSGRIEPVCVVMPASVSAAHRMTEMTLNPAFLSFVGEELLPWVSDTIGFDPGTHAVIGGWSLGGLTAAYAAMHLPQFDAAIAISGSFWWPLGTPFDEGAEALTQTLATDHGIAPVDWYIEIGRGEAIQLAQSRHFANVARARGHRVRYTEHGGGHDLANASAGLAHALIAMLGG